MISEAQVMIVAMSGVIITEIILVLSVLRLTRQLKLLNMRLQSTMELFEAKLHYVADKINFDIPKIMEQARLMFALFKPKTEGEKK